ncbi:hypothetical protein C8R44DRAFT_871215 [Mycena epipterygia]|nr:hypothetical protein C8R44DRAFT_871215 [Mycena epipterygia]
MGSGSPALFLPPEVTSVIFGHCLPSGPRWPSPHEAPLLLAQICCQWRGICLGTPDLWESIAFGETRSVELLKLWLSLAGNRPLTLHIESAYDNRAGILMDAIIPHCPQWHDVHLTLPVSAYHLLSMYRGPFLMLQKFEVFARSTERLDVADPVVAIRDAPLLCDVRIYHFPYPQVDLPWEQLTTLHFSPFADAAQTITALRRCPNLLHLVYNLAGGQHSALTPLTLRSLQSLTIPNVSIFPHLVVPRLERLNVMRRVVEIDAAISVLQSLSCLQYLSARPHDMDPASFQRFLCAANSIVHLRLFFLRPAGFHHQIEVLENTSILPGLKHLEIHDNAGGDRYGPLLSVLSSRRAVLESFELSLGTRSLGPSPPRIPPDAVMAQFHALSQTGLKIQIYTRERPGSLFTILDATRTAVLSSGAPPE